MVKKERRAWEGPCIVFSFLLALSPRVLPQPGVSFKCRKASRDVTFSRILPRIALPAWPWGWERPG